MNSEDIFKIKVNEGIWVNSEPEADLTLVQGGKNEKLEED